MAKLGNSDTYKQWLRDEGFTIWIVLFQDFNQRSRSQLFPYPADQTNIAAENSAKQIFHFYRWKGMYQLDNPEGFTLQTPIHVRGLLNNGTNQIPFDHYFIADLDTLRDMYALQNITITNPATSTAKDWS